MRKHKGNVATDENSPRGETLVEQPVVVVAFCHVVKEVDLEVGEPQPVVLEERNGVVEPLDLFGIGRRW